MLGGGKLVLKWQKSCKKSRRRFKLLESPVVWWFIRWAPLSKAREWRELLRALSYREADHDDWVLCIVLIKNRLFVLCIMHPGPCVPSNEIRQWMVASKRRQRNQQLQGRCSSTQSSKISISVSETTKKTCKDAPTGHVHCTVVADISADNGGRFQHEISVSCWALRLKTGTSRMTARTGCVFEEMWCFDCSSLDWLPWWEALEDKWQNLEVPRLVLRKAASSLFLVPLRVGLTRFVLLGCTPCHFLRKFHWSVWCVSSCSVLIFGLWEMLCSFLWELVERWWSNSYD